ncbi:dcn1-like protein [Anaeramoeba flamelloides]|uniref:Defective in cullin neddylation protein n=1 Tax=Anaeramoeba flamelloides TaxID=1746091 RepID=A0AAV8AEK5_9EUKA|nr:dcn1-like protein [Anaeramoeba flamelloides]KAJ6255421.1 dcn1-like protein [Anaeramoeba flamelloides]
MSLNNSQNEKVRQFMVFTNAPLEFSKNVLSTYNWQLDRAIDQYFTQNLSAQVEREKELEEQNKKKIIEEKRKKYQKTYTNRDKIRTLFNKYKDQETGFIEFQGLASLLEDIELDLLDIKALIFCWFFRAKEQGKFTRDEFIEGMVSLNCDCIEDLKKRKEFLIYDIDDKEQFKNFYHFVFDFSKEDPNHKFLTSEVASQLWKLLFKDKYKLTENWLEFLTKEECKKKTISFDVWRCIVDFLGSVKEVSDYNENEAWPVIIDEFMDYMKEEKN